MARTTTSVASHATASTVPHEQHEQHEQQQEHQQSPPATAAAAAPGNDAQRLHIFDELIGAVQIVDKVWPDSPVTKPLLRILTLCRNDAALGIKGKQVATLCTRLLECLSTIEQQFHGRLPPPLAGFTHDLVDKIGQMQSVVDKYTRESSWVKRIAKNSKSLDSLAGMEKELKDLLQYVHFSYSIYASGVSDAPAVEQQQQQQQEYADERPLAAIRKETIHPATTPERRRQLALSLAKQYEDAADKPNYFEAIFWYKYIAEKDETVAAVALTAIGNILQYGNGDFVCNYQEARHYYERAFRLSDYTAMTRIGRMHLEGKLSDNGQAKEYSAVECFHKALNRDARREIHGDISALSLLGRMHEKHADTLTVGASADEIQQHQVEILREAEDVYYEGVQLGNAMCVVRLADLYRRFDEMGSLVKAERRRVLSAQWSELERNNDPRVLLESAFSALGAEDYVKARELLDKARKHGNKMAACYLGKLEERDGNLHAAEEYYRLSARTQCPEGLRCLGAFLLKHRQELAKDSARTEVDCLKEATQTLESAVRHGDGLSAYYLGNYFAAKRSASDRAEGLKWYSEGARLKNSHCMRSLAWVSQNDSARNDRAHALVLYTQAARLGDAPSQLQLALMSLNGYRTDDIGPWLIPLDLNAAQAQFDRLTKLPEHAINPLLRAMGFLSLARIAYTELSATTSNQVRLRKLKLSRDYLLTTYRYLGTIGDVQSSMDISAAQVRRYAHRLLEDYSAPPLTSTLEYHYTRQLVTDLAHFRFVVLVLSDAAGDVVAMNENKSNHPDATPSDQETAVIWKKLRTAADLAYVGASQNGSVECMLSLSFLCKINIPASGTRLPQYQEVLKDCPEQYERSVDFWWREKPFSSLRCKNDRIDGGGRCNAIDYIKFSATTNAILWAAGEVDKALGSDYIFRSGWDPESCFWQKVTSATRPLCVECEQARDNRILYPQRYYASDAPRDPLSQEALMNEADIHNLAEEDGSADEVQHSCHEAIEEFLQANLAPLAPGGDLHALLVSSK
ncbi:hypothetical protein RI367_007288 [Sorochytrium milnesiophthora]